MENRRRGPKTESRSTYNRKRTRQRATRRKHLLMLAGCMVVIVALVMGCIVLFGGHKKSAPTLEQLIGTWRDDSGSMYQFHDTGVVGEYLVFGAETGIEPIISTAEWSLTGNILSIGNVSAECSVYGDKMTWGKAEYMRTE